MDNVVAQIQHFNLGRDPERLGLKYRALRRDAFSFFRGTCHLFWSEAPRSFWSGAVPLVWTCGDLHLENFGCYKGDDRLVYFDVNDFDEAVAAPCYCDPVRLMASIMVAARVTGSGSVARALCGGFLASYAKALQGGRAYSVGRDSAKGLIGRLLEAARQRTRVELLDSRTEIRNQQRRLRIDGKKALPADKKQRVHIEKVMD